MLPFIPLLVAYAPQLLKSIFGDRGAAVSSQVSTVIRDVTGADPSTAEGVAAAQAALAGKPELETQLAQKLAEIAAAREAEANREADASRQGDLEELKVQVADIGNARQQTLTLAAKDSPLAWGAPVMSGIIVVAFAGMLAVLVTKGDSLGDKILPLANVMFGTLAAMATQVGNYWLGSSSGSKAKNTMLADAQHKLWISTPPQSAIDAAARVNPASPASPAASFNKTAQPISADDLNSRSLAAARMR
jgi:hypothetical protein